ncbi:MAG: O-antigen translocase [Flavobacteriaceae bacterium]
MLLKMTSLNAPVIIVRQVISLFIRRLIAENFGESGIFLQGQLRSLVQLLTSFSSLGIFNGVVKYISEYKEEEEKLRHLFSTTFVFTTVGTIASAMGLLFWCETISQYLFNSTSYTFLIQLMAVMVPFISLQRVFNGVINGLSQYKKFAKIDMVSYLVSSALTLYFLYEKNFDGVLISIAVTPLIQLVVLLWVFTKTLKEYITYKNFVFKAPMAKLFLAFSLMSFFSTVVLSSVEIEIRNLVLRKISENDAGIWSAMLDLSKNYMAFSTILFTMYVIPKFAVINTKQLFFKEMGHVYKTILPLFGFGMLLVYLFKGFIIDLIFPGFDEMSPLFKWQLIGDFVRLIGMVLSYYFISKKLVYHFIFTEILSIGLFYVFARYFIDIYGVEGVVIGHFVRYIVYLLVVFFLVYRYINTNNISSNETLDE